MARSIQWWFKINGSRIGYTSETIGRDECPYLHRKILWLGICSLRYHVFFRSDEDRALHDHPWWFITLPLNSYEERYTPVEDDPRWTQLRRVTRFLPHFRPAWFRHRVIVPTGHPVRTLVLTGPLSRDWGFWLLDKFMPHKRFLVRYGTPACADDSQPTKGGAQ